MNKITHINITPETYMDIKCPTCKNGYIIIKNMIITHEIREFYAYNGTHGHNIPHCDAIKQYVDKLGAHNYE